MMVVNKKNYLTKEGYEKLAQELHDLKMSKLPKILERLAEAKALGDLSENFEYKTALEDKDFIESRMAEVEDLISNVEILKDDKKTSVQKGVIDFGSAVILKIDGEKYNVSIVGIGEVSIESDDILKISLDSPIGMAIKGCKKGDLVKVKLPAGRQEIEVLEVR